MAAIDGESDIFQRQGLVLQLILALKQVCNHPAHYLKQGAADPAASGKAERLLDLLDEIGAAREKALVFTQFREMGELLARMLQERHGREPLFLHGGVSRAGRDRMVERFQEEPGQRVFLLSLKAGGTGLNLTAASHVVHFDLWWNPAVEAQATDRAYRIGQQRKVQVHRFITRGTFEERINEMIRAKRELAEMTLATALQDDAQAVWASSQALPPRAKRRAGLHTGLDADCWQEGRELPLPATPPLLRTGVAELSLSMPSLSHLPFLLGQDQCLAHAAQRVREGVEQGFCGGRVVILARQSRNDHHLERQLSLCLDDMAVGRLHLRFIGIHGNSCATAFSTGRLAHSGRKKCCVEVEAQGAKRTGAALHRAPKGA
jgi:hypothetical protein